MTKWYGEAGPENDVVLASAVQLRRNFNGVPFPNKMSLSERRAAVKTVGTVFLNPNLPLYGKYHFLSIEELSGTEAVSLVEHFLAAAEFISDPMGKGLWITEDEARSLLINEEDHAVIQVFCPGLDLAGAFDAADFIDDILNKELHFAFDPKLGYLTQNPVNLGTGMRVSLYLHLPAMADSGLTSRFSANLSRLGLSFHGARGTDSQPRGSIYRLSNNVTLGLSEQEAIANLNSIAMQVISQERSLREKLKKKLSVQDTVWRSFGILKNAHLLREDEFWNLISIVRLGVATGTIPGIAFPVFFELMERVQPATLMKESGRLLTTEEQEYLRAGLVRKLLQQSM